MAKTLPNNDFPYTTRLNLSPLINYWKQNLDTNQSFDLYPTDDILKKIEAAPELNEPIDDLDILKKHQKLVGLLMSAIMPPALIETDLAAALVPFNFNGFYATPGYKEILPFDQIREDVITSVKNNDFSAAKVMRAGIYILKKLYHVDLTFDEPILLTVPNLENGLKKIYKVEINTQFAEVIPKGNLKPLSEKVINILLDDLYNKDLWLQHLSPNDFEFQGFTICRLIDVTVEEMISSIKYDLLKKDAVTCPHSFESIQEKIRAVFQLPKIKLGLSFFDINNRVISNHGFSAWNSFVMPCLNESMSCDYFKDSLYDKSFQKRRTIVIEDLEKLADKTEVENRLLAEGFKNVAVAPLIYDDKIIGMLELGTPIIGKLNPVSASKINALIPMFTAAVRRVLDDMKMEVKAIIQEQYTAIHPSVEWRFLEEGYKLIAEKNNGNKAAFGDIIFPDVYPIYGQSDIRNSSIERNNAIRQDLIDNLKEAKKVVKAILQDRSMPILDEIVFRIDQEHHKIAKGLNSGDESAVVDFLKNDIAPAFEHFRQIDAQYHQHIDHYQRLLDPNLGVIYNKRKSFEESLTQINEVISTYMDEVEEKAQEIFPHYFEKYKTDGVEYNIYIGQSLVKDKTFNPLYLHNFRLWQLITMSQIAVKINDLKSSLALPLDITQLVLLHGEPLSIKFRKDEKHFDVDGAYNIRYEIVKKRIDKAYIKGTDERLTQPGKIAIVYSQPKEAEEYMRYISYLQSIKYLTKEVEFVELEELQGAHGLKAMRVGVDFRAHQKTFGHEVIQQVIDTIHVN